MQRTDDSDFDRFAWHDDPLYGFALRLGDPAANDWSSDLVLDIDHIVEWVRDGAAVRFRVAPATLVFHGTSDLRIKIDWGLRGWQVAPSPPTIDRIQRERLPEAQQRIYLDRPYYAWRIAFSSPVGGSISFGALGFDLTLRGEPVLHDEQRVPASLRRSLG
jgi:hypothetical protein